MIHRFHEQAGKYIERIYGQECLAYAMSDNEDLYDLIEWAERGGYPGSVICFYDFESGETWTPFEKKRDVIYGKPIFSDGFYYFLQADHGEQKITLFRFRLGEAPCAEAELAMEGVDLYNLQLIGEKIHIVSQNEEFRCYYPEAIRFPMHPQETCCFMEEGKIYFERWIEEGWDEEKNRAGEDYDFYHKVITRDFDGSILSEELGYLHQREDGSWWIA